MGCRGHRSASLDDSEKDGERREREAHARDERDDRPERLGASAGGGVAGPAQGLGGAPDAVVEVQPEGDEGEQVDEDDPPHLEAADDEQAGAALAATDPTLNFRIVNWSRCHTRKSSRATPPQRIILLLTVARAAALAMLESAGSSLERVVRVHVVLADISQMADMDRVYREFFPVDPPARTAWSMQLRFGNGCEIECVALAG